MLDIDLLSTTAKIQLAAFITSGRGDRAGFYFHKGISKGAEYQCVFPTEENVLWKQKTGEGSFIW